MRRGFILRENLCVNCKACSAACILENGWHSGIREIFTFNQAALDSLPVIHISLACNHCENPVCLNGCPSNSYSRDADSGAVIFDDEKCLGCSYCVWNCPYNSPKLNLAKGIIEKCNLCFPVVERPEPACASACPTGALEYGDIPDAPFSWYPEWFPDKGLNPAFVFADTAARNALKVVPANGERTRIPAETERINPVSKDWSLICFTFLTTLSVALTCSSLIKGNFREILSIAVPSAAAGIISLFHLGRKGRAWRAVTNIGSSPLSREILLFGIFNILSLTSILLQSPGLLLAASVTGLILLPVIDSVYLLPDNSARIKFHQGQTFLSGLILTSFLAGTMIPFLFLALLKLIATAYNFLTEKGDSPFSSIKLFRIALLLISSSAYAAGIFTSGSAISAIIFAGEIIDRIAFYNDFNPVNIKSLIMNKLNN